MHRHLRSLIVVLAGLGSACAGRGETPPNDPWAAVPRPPKHLDHSPFFSEPFTDGPSVTRACLECHETSAHEVMQTSHYTWKGDDVRVPGHASATRIGKANLINNFCIGVQPNLPNCTTCHPGYGWKDDQFDFSEPTLVDCLVCHDQSRTYAKKPGGAGLPDDDVDLLAVAQSVGRPTRANCGACHFDGGGGDAVKHGDLDRTLIFPTERIDVHMGRLDFECVDCHRAPDHEIQGRSMSVSVQDNQRVRCEDCHGAAPHALERLNDHGEAIACTTCHVPRMAVETPTKMSWDWSTAGQDQPAEDAHHYLKKKGSFEYAARVEPEYAWYNGLSKRYLLGDQINVEGVTPINEPLGTIEDPTAKIWPFKVHRGKQIYDLEHQYFMVPKTAGEGGYWTTFDWDHALRLGSAATGLEYSGRYGFAPTVMYWPLAHMVPPKAEALQCIDCHGHNTQAGRMNWETLGYSGDPAERGARRAQARLARERHRGEP